MKARNPQVNPLFTPFLNTISGSVKPGNVKRKNIPQVAQKPRALLLEKNPLYNKESEGRNV